MGSLSNSRATTPVSEFDATKVATYNAALQVLDSLESGKLDVAITTADVTLTGAPAAPQAQNKYFNLTGASTASRSLIFPVNDDDPAVGNPRTIYVKNGTTGGFAHTVKVSGQTGVTVTQGTTAILLHNGTDFVKIIEVTTSTGFAAGQVFSSTYTPTLTHVANLDGTTALVVNYTRIGNMVIIGGQVNADPTTAAVATRFSFSLPVASAFTLQQDAGGSGTAASPTPVPVFIYADATNDCLEFQWLPTDTANQSIHFSASYVIK